MKQKLKNIISFVIIPIFFSVLFILLNGYHFGIVDHNATLPFLAKIANPSLFPNDFYIKELANYPTLFIYLLAFINKFLDMEVTMFLTYLVSVILFFISLIILGKTIFQDKIEAYIFSSLFLVSEISGFPVFDPITYQRNFILPFEIYSLTLFLKKKYRFSFLLLGFCALIHLHSAFYLFFALSVAYLFTERNLKGFVKLTALFLLAYSPLLVLQLLNKKVSLVASDNFDWYKIIKQGYYYLSINFFQWTHRRIRDVLPVIFSIFSGLFFLRRKKEGLTTHSFLFLGFLLLTLVYLLEVLANGSLPFSVLITLFQFHRAINFTLILLVIIETTLIFFFVKKGKQYLLSVVPMFFTLFFHQYGLNLCYTLTAILFFTWESNKNKKHNIFFFGLFFFVLFLLVIYSSNLFYFDSLYYLVFLIFLLTQRHSILIKKNSSLITFVLLAAFSTSSLIRNLPLSDRMVFTNQKEEGKVYFFPGYKKSDWENVQIWARDNSKIDDVFLTPPYLAGFRNWSQRTAVIEQFNYIFTMLSYDFSKEWQKRMQDVSCGEAVYSYAACYQQYNHSSVEKLTKIANKYSASYIVREIRYPLDLPIVFANKSFAIYKLP